MGKNLYLIVKNGRKGSNNMGLGIDMTNYKMIYNDQVFNVLSIWLTVTNDDGGKPKPKFIQATYIDENGEVKIVEDEAWCFKFVRR
jgi:hypothetical protein